MKRFLLIDDDRDDRDLFSEAMFEVAPQISCECVGSWKEATGILESAGGNPDLIFLDINLPVVSGWQCLDILKKNELYQDIPVVIYSTSSHDRDIKTAKEMGAVSFVTKPNDFGQLKDSLKKVVDQNVAE